MDGLDNGLVVSLGPRFIDGLLAIGDGDRATRLKDLGESLARDLEGIWHPMTRSSVAGSRRTGQPGYRGAGPGRVTNLGHPATRAHLASRLINGFLAGFDAQPAHVAIDRIAADVEPAGGGLDKALHVVVGQAWRRHEPGLAPITVLPTDVDADRGAGAGHVGRWRRDNPR